MTAEIMSFFERNPFSTPVGQRIEQATDASLASENWALNMEICDLINDTEDGPKDGIKALRKRLQQNAGKNHTVVMYTLTVLETCVKNCGRRFHLLACNKEFVQELVKIIGPKNEPPTVVQEKVLNLIQSWADAFRHQTELQGVVQVYNDLRQKGIEFPMTDLDTMAPIITPQRVGTSVAEQRAPSPASVPIRPAVGAPSSPTGSPPTLVGTEAVTAAVAAAAAAAQSVTAEQLAKLRSELDVVQTNMTVLGSMLSEVTPGQEHPSDLSLLQELHATCRAMQRRLVDLIGKVAHDQLTAELLRVNDEMNNLFLRYSRYEKNREAYIKGKGGVVAGAAAGAAGAEAASLIDLSDNDATEKQASKMADISSISAGIAAMSAGGATSQLSQIASLPAQQGAETADSEFDMFAQARNVTYESSKKGSSSYADNLQPDQTSASLGELAQSRSQAGLHRDTDIHEIEAWLDEEPGEAVEAKESLTSSEFERFLAERAAAAEQLPTMSSGGSSTRANPSGRPSGTPNTRELDKDEPENTMFAL